MTLDEEKQLIEKAKTDKNAFVRLYDHYYSGIFGYVLRRTLDLEKTKDLTSEIFIKAYLNIGKFHWRNISFSSWLFRIATNEMNMADRKKRFMSVSLDHLLTKTEWEPVDSQSLKQEQEELQRQLKQSFDFLIIHQKLLLISLKYREVIALRFFEEKTIKEIAEILGKKEGTVKSILSRGLGQLRKLL